jgi:hypothetical protein
MSWMKIMTLNSHGKLDNGNLGFYIFWLQLVIMTTTMVCDNVGKMMGFILFCSHVVASNCKPNIQFHL